MGRNPCLELYTRPKPMAVEVPDHSGEPVTVGLINGRVKLPSEHLCLYP